MKMWPFFSEKKLRSEGDYKKVNNYCGTYILRWENCSEISFNFKNLMGETFQEVVQKHVPKRLKNGLKLGPNMVYEL